MNGAPAREIGYVLVVVAATLVLFGPAWWQPVNTCLAGGAPLRAQAQLPEALRERYLDAAAMRAGLGSAAIGGWESLGDALAVGGRVWLRTTHKASPRYYRVVANRYFQSNYFVSVPVNRDSGERLLLRAGTSLRTLADELARRFPAGVLAAGYARFATLDSIAIAEPAVGGEPIARHAARYYTRPMGSASDTWVYLVMLAGAPPAAGTHAARLLPAGEKAARHAQLAHVLRLHGVPVDRQAPPASGRVVSLGQALDTSTLADGELALYPVARVGDCTTTGS
jgi:hypothetical protein